MREGWYLEKIMDNVSLLIHGPLKEDTYKFYCRFYPEVPKIFSTWEGNEHDMNWKTESADFSSDVLLIKSKKPERFGLYEIGTDRRVVVTLIGLEKIKTNYCILLRGDEWYSNLECLKKYIEEDSDKIYTTNMFFRKWEVCQFHPGDHLLAGSTDNLRLMFGRTMINMVTKKKLNTTKTPLSPAAILGRSYMEAKIGESSDWKKDFAKSFEIVDLETFKYYKVVSDESGSVWYSNFDPNKDGSWEKSIARMEDL